MLWGIMDLQFSRHPACLLSREGLVQGGNGMGIEIIHDKYNLLFVRVAGVHKVFDFPGPVSCSPVFADTYMPYASQWLNKHKYAAGTVPDIFGIGLLDIPRTHRQWFPGFAQ